MLFTLALVALVICYCFLRRHYQYWTLKGIAGPSPNCLFGNLTEQIGMKKSQGQIFSEIYRQFDDDVVGVFQIYSPALLVRDPTLVKDILNKEFSSFHDHDIDVDKKRDPLFGRNPFCLQGNEWKVVRSHISPCFTSSKVKTVYPLLTEGSNYLVNYVENNCTAIEAKHLCRRFTLNNVANCAFGIEGKCLEDEHVSDFERTANRFLSPNSRGMLFIVLSLLCPPIARYLPVKYVDKDVEDKLISIVDQNLQYREANNTTRFDYLNILRRVKQTCSEFEFTNVDVTAHAAGFFSDGYETSAAVMSFMLYALAANSEVQERLRAEIRERLNDNAQDDCRRVLDFATLQDMPYLEACFSETLRMYPPVYTLRKRCTKPYQLPNNVVIEKGTSIILPMYAMHHDPQYFEDPNTFNPERFLGANKANIQKGTYYPFGDGPRTCIGQRFGITQVKTGVSQLVHNFEIRVNEKTKRPLVFEPKLFVISVRGGIWLDFKRIES